MATLRRSEFAHLITLSDQRVLVVHAITQLRWTINHELAELIRFFERPRLASRALTALERKFGYDKMTLRRTIAGLVERRILSDRTRENELAEITDVLGAGHGRDPAELMAQYQHGLREGVDPYFSISNTQGIEDVATTGQRINVIMFGDCELQMEADFLRRAGTMVNLDLRVSGAFPGDSRYAAEHPHDIVLIGALRSRHSIAQSGEAPAHTAYIAEARAIVTDLRKHTQAPILVDNLPDPTVLPLGFADQGAHSHRNRFRAANVALAEAVSTLGDVHVVDINSALAGAGATNLLDDGLVAYTHFGSAGWMLQRPVNERVAVHNIFPDMQPLAEAVRGNPYGREEVTALAHLDAIRSVMAIDAKKVVVVDLDGVLWPGVLAETGAPFAWTPEKSSAHSFVGLFFGIHEALRSLQRRGILLACVSKNDEDTVRALWKYPEHYPHNRLLHLDDFVTTRINWTDKATNIKSISEELGLETRAFVFIDDRPDERERIRVTLPEVALLGDNLFTLRRALLSDPRLAPARLTDEAGRRTSLVKSQLARERARTDAPSEADFITSLQVVTDIAQATGADFERVSELFNRTTQFNTTGRKFSVAQLAALTQGQGSAVFCLRVRDRFADHGLVGALVLEGEQIIAYAMSCRVMGLGGVENTFLREALAAYPLHPKRVTARIIETPRNGPARHLYRDNGFTREGDVWVLPLPASEEVG